MRAKAYFSRPIVVRAPVIGATRLCFKVFGIVTVAKPAIILLKLVYLVNRYIRFLAFLRPLLITENNNRVI